MNQFFSSIPANSSATPQLCAPSSNVLGATGLSRAALKAMLLRDGLFGADSDLSAAEQSALQERIGAVPGLAAHAFGNVPHNQSPRLAELVRFTGHVLRTDDPLPCDARKAMFAAGYSPAAIGEIIAVVRMVQMAFDARPIADQGARLARIDMPPEKAHAA